MITDWSTNDHRTTRELEGCPGDSQRCIAFPTRFEPRRAMECDRVCGEVRTLVSTDGFDGRGMEASDCAYSVAEAELRGEKYVSRILIGVEEANVRENNIK